MPDYYYTNQVIQVECLTFTIPFLKLPQNCLKLPKKMTIFMHNTQTDKFHPYEYEIFVVVNMNFFVILG